MQLNVLYQYRDLSLNLQFPYLVQVTAADLKLKQTRRKSSNEIDYPITIIVGIN